MLLQAVLYIMEAGINVSERQRCRLWLAVQREGAELCCTMAIAHHCSVAGPNGILVSAVRVPMMRLLSYPHPPMGIGQVGPMNTDAPTVLFFVANLIFPAFKFAPGVPWMVTLS